MKILAFESSCDETSVAVLDTRASRLNQIVLSQIPLHQQYGGVVPEVASRNHCQAFPGLINDCLSKAGLVVSDINAVAYTRGPGLVGALLVGASLAKTLAFSLNVPLIPVHHVEAHMLVTGFENPGLDFPYLALIVSGGHTVLLKAKKLGDYEILGQTLDDAAGEAFDKGGKLLGLGYPAGPEVARLSSQGQEQKALILPRPLLNRPGYDFSFSGLKTAFATMLAKYGQAYSKSDYCYALQTGIVSHLVNRIERYLKREKLPLVLAGGVACNKALRLAVENLMAQTKQPMLVPSPEYCTDNAGMIAYAASKYCSAKNYSPTMPADSMALVRPRWSLAEIKLGPIK